MKNIQHIIHRLVFISVLLALSGSVFCQTKTITGKVSDFNGESLPGAAIIVVGTTTGTLTDIDGKYSITVSSPDAVLSISFIGYLPENIPVLDKTVINVSLSPTIKNLEEVIVIGYGKAKKSDITSSIVSVKGDELKRETSGNFATTLQGKAAGVQVISGGSPGSVPQVLIRGFSTINLSTNPLYVVDGIPIVSTDGNSNVNFLNSDDIEHLEVLKDASAAAIYGTRASNGVILVTTKRGKTGKTVYNFNFTYGTQLSTKPYNVLNSPDYAQAMNLSYKNSGLTDLIQDVTNLNHTDWWAQGVRKYSPEMNASLSITGGNDSHQFVVSLTYFKQESFYHSGKWEKFTARINNDFKLANWLTAGIDLNPRRETWDNTPTWYGSYLLMDPITPVFRPADQLNGTENEYSKYMRSIYTYTWNPIAQDSRQFAGGENFALNGNSYIDIHPMKELVFRSQIGATVNEETDDTFNPMFVIDASHEFNSSSNITRKVTTDANWSWQNTLSYTLTKGKHSAVGMIGMTAEEQNRKFVQGYREGTPNTSVTMRELDASNGTVQKSTGNKYRNSIVSYLGRISYNYDNRYLINGTLREDGSSKFMAANKWAYFPSASVAWRLSNEQFMKQFSFISDAKIFAGYGSVGNQGLPSDVYLSKLSTDYYVLGSGSSVLESVTTMNTLKNKDIKWETIVEQNLGIDLSLFNSSLSSTIEVFKKTTNDMLFQKNYPFYSGYPNGAVIWSNIGSMQSKGIDIAVNYKHSVKNWQFDIGATVSKAKVKMVTLPGVSELFGGDLWNSANTTRTVVGDEPGYFYGYKTNGIFQNWTEINSHTSENGTFLQPHARPGDIRFMDVNNDGALNDKDRVKLGSPYPKFTGGLNLSTSYKTSFGEFDLALNIYFSYGSKVINYLLFDKYNAVSQNNLSDDALSKAWHGEGTSSHIPILSHLDLNENFTKFSDFYLEDGSFARLKNAQLGFSLPKDFLQKVKITQVRFYVSGQNLLTVTKFTGVDPEASFSQSDASAGFTPLKYGFQRWSYPLQKTILFGVKLTF